MHHVGHEPACFSCGEWAQLVACSALAHRAGACRPAWPGCLLPPTSLPTSPPADLAAKQQVAEVVKECLEKPYRTKAITKEEYK